eukprot:CAMPEP_0119570752 /NCGR_PEP_ID=MMETSP1352-20130426/43770_1 /TAXON_ID=265584 /ORGANISM="Stauroneis constricta, Strain CCMP1120" /LENGTH=898 /DNA_ID=CAMNT_0007620425 /DNA_START=121 /DNA_END=2820 /DNA_ORIENTATION=-
MEKDEGQSDAVDGRLDLGEGADRGSAADGRRDSCCSCACACSCACFCSWFLGILANVALVAFLLWSAPQDEAWVAGCVVSVVYSVVLWCIVHRYNRRIDSDTTTSSTTTTSSSSSNTDGNGLAADREQPKELGESDEEESVALVAFLLWSAPQDEAWVAGCVVSVVYSVVLWCIVHRYNRRIDSDTTSSNSNSNTNGNDLAADREQPKELGESDEEESEPADTMRKIQPAPPRASPKTPNFSVAHSLWYLLAVLSIGAPQAFVIFHVFPCFHWERSGSSYTYNEYTWTTNITSLPSDAVREYYQLDQKNSQQSEYNRYESYDSNYDEYSYNSMHQQCRAPLANGTIVTYTSGGDYWSVVKNEADASTQFMQRIADSKLVVFVGDEMEPRILDEYTGVSWITQIDPNNICFVASTTGDGQSSRDKYFDQLNALVCGQYGAFETMRLFGDKPTSLMVINDQLWFKQVKPNAAFDPKIIKKYEKSGLRNVLRQDALYRNLIRGHAVVSMDIGSKEQTVWSELAKQSPDNSGDGDDDYDDNEDEDEDMYYNGNDRHRQLRNEFKNQKCYRNLIRGHAVVSMDIGSKEQTVWSELAKPSPKNSGDGYITSYDDYDDNEDEDMNYDGNDRHRQLRNEFKNQKCEEYGMSRWRSSAALLSIALPITILSARLWLTKAVPTSSVTFFIGMMLTFMFIGALLDPWTQGMGGLAIWNIAGSTVFFFLSTFQLSVDTKVSKAPFWWAMYVISLMTLLWAGMGIIGEFMNARMYSYEVESDEVITWIGTSIFVFIPIAVSGCLVNSRLLFCMGMLGLALDASVATLRLFDGKESNGWKVTIIVLCTLLFGAVGISVLRRWAFIHGKLVGWMSRCTAHVCSVEMPRDGDADDNAEEAAGLLLKANNEAEAA